jgi:hypothetical protein
MESVNKKPKLKELPSDQLSGQNSLFMDEEELERAEEEYSLERADKEYEEYKRNTEDRIEPILQEFLACIKTIDKSTLKKMGKVVKDFEREWGEDGVDGLSIYLMSYVDHVLPNIEKEKLMQKVYIYKPRFFAEGEGFKKETIISETPIEWLADCQIPIEGGGQ